MEISHCSLSILAILAMIFLFHLRFVFPVIKRGRHLLINFLFHIMVGRKQLKIGVFKCGRAS